MAALNLKIPPRDLKSKDGRHLLSLIFSQWLSLSTCVIQAAIDIVPAPAIAQASRIPKILYPDIYDQTIKAKNKLEEDLFTSSYAADACVSAYVSKMFAVSSTYLPENKKKSMTADDMRARAREAREARLAAEESQASGTSSPVNPGADRSSTSAPPPAEDSKKPDEVSEIILGFARIYSGTIRVGTDVYCVLPKFRTALGPTHPQNAKYIMRTKVEGLYVMMGRELVPVDSVRAGNTFAIRGLEGKVWRSATLCSPSEVGISDNDDAERQKDCLINLGGVKRSVRVLELFRYPIIIDPTYGK